MLAFIGDIVDVLTRYGYTSFLALIVVKMTHSKVFMDTQWLNKNNLIHIYVV